MVRLLGLDVASNKVCNQMLFTISTFFGAPTQLEKFQKDSLLKMHCD